MAPVPFVFHRNVHPMKNKALRYGCALRAKEVWLPEAAALRRVSLLQQTL